MKKKYLLGLLPALLALSACNGLSQPEKEQKNILLEDTLAHDEIFDGKAFEERSLAPQKLLSTRSMSDPDPVEHPDNDPVIGVQSFVDGDYVSFRFVAAVSFTTGAEGNLGPTTASWRRTVSKVTTTNTETGAYTLTYPKDTADFAVTKAYLSLSASGGSYSIGQFNEAHGNSSYTHFVVYTLRNVPIVANEDYYVCAYLTLSDGVSLVTKAIAVNSRQSLKATHDRYLGAFFLTGSFTDTPVMATSSRSTMDSDARATFEGIRMSKNQRFVLNEFYDTKLYVKGSSTQLTGNGTGTYFELSNGQLNSKLDGLFTYTLTYWNSEAIETSCTSVKRKLYVRMEIDGWWDKDALLFVYAYGTGGDHWFKVGNEISNKYYQTLDEIDYKDYQSLIIARINPSYPNGSWDGNWGQTDGYSIPLDNKNCAFVYGELTQHTACSINVANL